MREAFLQRVRQAVTEGNRTGSAAPLPTRGNLGVAFRQAGAAGVERFCAELAVAGGQSHLVSTVDEMRTRTLAIIDDKKARRILLGPVFPELDLAARLRGHGLTVASVQELTPADCREEFFRADLGIGGATHLVAETGSVVVASAPAEPRSVSLLPPVHVVLAHAEQVLPDLFDLFERFGHPVLARGASEGSAAAHAVNDLADAQLSAEPSLARRANPADRQLPSCLSIITGPSKTGDIELKLVTGVHGPGEVHVILGTWTR